ncbi:hypothetical protein B0O99DRAFT_683086 [Bisporella sp. PMI_857]|nr:hypothetical protein B0O99DRAFT_683086 [Bisporella sp. PMI_857]
MEAPSRPDQARPEPGQILIVIHDFSARSSDELSLSKGDRVELIERDDDFGDGWYLGRHISSGQSGLFPEVYTRIAPRGAPSYPPTNLIPKSYSASEGLQVKQEPVQLPLTASIEPSTTIDSRLSTPSADLSAITQGSQHSTTSETNNNMTRPLSPKELDASVPPPISISAATPPIPNSLSMTSAVRSHGQGNDSPVMNETLSVIDEHITDMNSPHHSIVTERRGNDSGSEYSSHLDHRLSYINGEETDEEEEAQSYHTREEVMIWNADQVAEYLFTLGVEAKHCEVFRDQEITGDVLLGMDQTSVFLKEFDLGSVGRRLKTWQRIKSLQDDLREETRTRRNTATYGSEISHDDSIRNRSRSETSTSIIARAPSVIDRPISRQNSRLSQQHTPPATIARSDTVKASPVSPKTIAESPGPAHEKRPSAASIREMQHSRQSSAADYNIAAAMTASDLGGMRSTPVRSPTKTKDAHKKQPSFDRNWTMGSAISPPLSTPLPSRPLSSSGLQGIVRSATDYSKSPNPSSTFDTLDRGYFSGGEAEGRQRNVLRKRTTSQGTHSRNSSYTDEQRMRSATTHTRHSRFGSVDSVRASTPPSAAQKYYGLSVSGGRRRTPSESSFTTGNTPPRPPPPPKDFPSPVTSPTVTKLEGNPFENVISPKSTSTKPQPADWLLPTKSSRGPFGLRAISDAVTGHEKRAAGADPLSSPVKESPVQSPSTRTGSSTPSGGPSFDLDSPDAKVAMTVPPNPSKSRKKSKKETSAYTRGLEKKTPQEQMVGADYSGWMKKKSTNLMTTWKPRLFVLKGRRLSYYYSEDDQQEKGLIDISFHRVLPADNDRLTGLHATLTGATNSPTSPNGPHTETIASKQAAAEPESTLSKGSDQMFIFKLVPPRAGLSRAVTFTKPTVHYFAVPNIKTGRLWMAALMKATIDRDDSKPITTTYQQKTISLAKARMMRHRPPALMNLDEHADEEALKTPASDKNGLNIQGIIYDKDDNEDDSGVSGVSKPDAQSAGLSNGHAGLENTPEPRTA